MSEPQSNLTTSEYNRRLIELRDMAQSLIERAELPDDIPDRPNHGELMITDTIDKLFLELAQITSAKIPATHRVVDLATAVEEARREAFDEAEKELYGKNTDGWTMISVQEIRNVIAALRGED